MVFESNTYKLRGARPNLNVVAPLTAYICWGYVMVNALLGIGMILLYKTTVAPIAVASILNYPEWGITFLLLAAVTAYGLIKNSWKLVRNAQLFGLFLKAIWSVALIIRCIAFPQTILVTSVWLFLAYVQIGVYVHFIPPLPGENINGS